MALIHCPECDKEISDRAQSCPGCGCPITSGDADITESHTDTNSSNEILNLLTQSKDAYYGKNYELAVKYANRVLEIDPRNVEALVTKAKAVGWSASVNNITLQESLFTARKVCDTASEIERTACIDSIVPIVSEQIFLLISNILKMPSIGQVTYRPVIHSLFCMFAELLYLPYISSNVLREQLANCATLEECAGNQYAVILARGTLKDVRKQYNGKQYYYETIRSNLSLSGQL